MHPRWPEFHRPGLGWTRTLNRKVEALRHPQHGGFMSIVNAIEYQLEIGAHPETLRHLIAALQEFAWASNVHPQAIGIEGGPGAMIRRLEPKTKHTR